MIHRSIPVLLLGLSLGCGSSEKPAEKVKPAKVEKLPVETELSRVTLTPEAEQRLGIKIESVREIDLPRRRTFGGDLMVPPGKAIIVSAPVSGRVTTKGTEFSPPGTRLAVGDVVLKLEPLLTPERYVPTPAELVQMANAKATLSAAFITAEGEVSQGEAQLEAAEITLKRAKQLLADRAGSARAVDDAQAQVNAAKTFLEAAKKREAELSRLAEQLDMPLKKESDQSGADTIDVRSPESGVLRTLSVSHGQTVVGGSPLFEVDDMSLLWVRVPVYPGLLDVINQGEPALVVSLNGGGAGEGREAEPVRAPPSADPLSTTADLYYAIDNADAKLRPGQRVGVELTLREARRQRVIPSKSLLYDIHGGTWVYVQTGERQFERRRVEVRFTEGDLAAIARGPEVGTAVVTDGTAELFGTEFGAGK